MIYFISFSFPPDKVLSFCLFSTLAVSLVAARNMLLSTGWISISTILSGVMKAVALFIDDLAQTSSCITRYVYKQGESSRIH
jgi:hypothetical protein